MHKVIEIFTCEVGDYVKLEVNKSSIFDLPFRKGFHSVWWLPNHLLPSPMRLKLCSQPSSFDEGLESFGASHFAISSKYEHR